MKELQSYVMVYIKGDNGQNSDVLGSANDEEEVKELLQLYLEEHLDVDNVEVVLEPVYRLERRK